MQPKMIITGEISVTGITGDGAKTAEVWNKFEGKYAKSLFPKVGEDAYEIRYHDGERKVTNGKGVHVGYACDEKCPGFTTQILPAGEYAVFDVLVANGYDSENAAMEQWLDENKERYIRRQISCLNAAVERYVPEKFKGGDKPDSVVEIWLPVSRVGESIIPLMLGEASFDYIKPDEKAFIAAFDGEMEKRGYSTGNSFGYPACFWRRVLIYDKVGRKSKSITARIYFLNTGGIMLRMYFNNIDKHRAYLEAAPEGIRRVFAKGDGDCHHCKSGHRASGECKFRKTYTLNGETIEKCSGEVFSFYAPILEMLPEYMALFDEFYPAKTGGA
jgi:predicted transcriptional regulator YdeE